jgi:hypothetical protein
MGHIHIIILLSVKEFVIVLGTLMYFSGFCLHRTMFIQNVRLHMIDFFCNGMKTSSVKVTEMMDVQLWQGN